mmetsp:Transcript_5500/g.11981  ORF Transcript_5500/g.11981 Transcript_5500/m.11981 type:complete len:372 (-) Transcript_5500:194-1309(-)
MVSTSCCLLRQTTSRQLFPSLVDTIGNTPLVEITRFRKQSNDGNINNLQGRIFAKLEYFNPGGSKKDRIAKHIIDSALSRGKLRAGDDVVELTSGNTGTGLAIVCAVRGLRFHAVMSRGNSPERAAMMRALGANVELVDQAPGSAPGMVSGSDLDLVEDRCREMVEEMDAFRVDQFRDRGGADAHYFGTATEILEQCDGGLDAFVDFVGTAGTFGGCAKYFKEQSEGRIKCFVVEPAGSEVLAREATRRTANGSNIFSIDECNSTISIDGCRGHVVQGGGYSKTLSDLKLLSDASEHIDGFIQVSDAEAIGTARLLAKTEGIFGGFSGGANVAAAVKVLQMENFRGSSVCALICDSGLKYMSTGLWKDGFT